MFTLRSRHRRPVTAWVNGQPITEGGAPVTVPNGTVALVGGQLVFTPAPGFTGPASFGYTVTDPSGATDSATVTVNVGQANLAPVAQDDTNATDEDTPLTVSAGDGVIQSGAAPGGVDSDPNGEFYGQYASAILKSAV